jgi:hypothetical protein
MNLSIIKNSLFKPALIFLVASFSLIQKTRAQWKNFLFIDDRGILTLVKGCDVPYEFAITVPFSGSTQFVVHASNFFSGQRASYLFYDNRSGVAITTTEANAGLTNVGTYNVGKDWTHILTINNATQVLFYNNITGFALITNSDFKKLMSINVGTAWTHIVDTGNNTTFFYNRLNGGGALKNNNFTTSRDYVMARGWDFILKTCNGILFYNMEVRNAKLSNSIDLTTLRTFNMATWTHVVFSPGCKRILCYNWDFGLAELLDCDFNSIKKFTLPPLFRKIVP